MNAGGHREILGAQPLVSTLVRTIFEQPDAESVRAQDAQVAAALEARPPRTWPSPPSP